ncbi:HlyD family efflux transporter periplasmic adaptor subunit [Mesorhizobium sp. BR1-1-2]|uniref:HlyD family efflux transporter periplasmic adaptor subunit n=1 Tax=Mesorhizobium sp. BR1-1-2 TaxID=2876652 RepID=UPI001CC9253E|nr:HlyD family efflux transporter periplasmic adaptor subunit [Mesorhizobium sp. BR1-1-2]MBZ9966924.1 HlyD family efflux transporter periplasmic adaptor subunit [Mesorhizobium sp. BR1-1-2]
MEVNTLGEVVQTGQKLMVIVPDGTKLDIEAMLLNRDKGFVGEGQEVRVNLEPFTRYGTLSGKVLTVSNDAIPLARRSSLKRPRKRPRGSAGPLVFPVRIALSEASIRVTAEVKTGNQRVLEFLLDPLMKMMDGA